MTIPTKWAVCQISWGEKRKHIWCSNNNSLKFFATRAEAEKEARSLIETYSEMAVVMEITDAFERRVEMNRICL